MTDQEAPAPADETLVDYIRANRDQWTRDALTAQLIERGHARDAVAAAWAEADADADADDASDTDADAGSVANDAGEGAEPRRARQTVLSGIAVLLALGAFVIGEFSLFAASAGRPMMLLYLVLFPIQIAVVTGWIVGRIGSSGGLRRGDAAMTLGWLLVPAIAMAALMGVCAGYGGTFGCVLDCA